MATRVFNLELSTAEVYCLCSLKGPMTLIGVSNPHLGLFAEEVEVMQQVALESLVARGLVDVREEQFSISKPSQVLVEHLSESQHVLIAVYIDGSKKLHSRITWHVLGAEVLEIHEHEGICRFNYLSRSNNPETIIATLPFEVEPNQSKGFSLATDASTRLARGWYVQGSLDTSNLPNSPDFGDVTSGLMLSSITLGRTSYQDSLLFFNTHRGTWYLKMPGRPQSLDISPIRDRTQLEQLARTLFVL